MPTPTGTITLTATPQGSDVGQAIRLVYTVKDASGALTNPATLSTQITQISGPATNVALLISDLTNDSVGLFHYDYLTPAVGTFSAQAVSTVPYAAADVQFAVETAVWQPSPNDVAPLVIRRTIDATGVPTGTFTSTTVPNTSQVQTLIQDIAGEITAACGTIPAVLAEDANLTTKLGVAALIEETFDEGTTQLAALYNTRYQTALGRLQTAAAQVGESGQVEPVGAPPAALFSFPDISGGDPNVDATTKYTTW